VSYSLQIKGSAAKALQRIGKSDRLRLIDAIDQLKEEPHVGKFLKGELSGLRRIRVGRYRVIYEVVEKHLVVLVVRVGHRRDVYR